MGARFCFSYCSFKPRISSVRSLNYRKQRKCCSYKHLPKMPNPPSRMGGDSSVFPIFTKKNEVVIFSSTAIALYGYDQGMMSLINTNRSYLRTMQIAEKSPIVGIIVSVYYLGCTLGAIIASWLGDKKGRKPSIFTCLATTALGNILMFISGFTLNGSSPWKGGAIACMLAGRVIMGLGVGGIDAVIPVYSSELSSDGARGRALAQEFQMNIFGLLLAYGINMAVTYGLGKDNQWAWRVPIVAMQIFPILLMSFISRLPESPRWFISKERTDDAKKALQSIYSNQDAKCKLEELQEANENEGDEKVGYKDMLLPGGSQFHPSMVTVMGQVNQSRVSHPRKLYLLFPDDDICLAHNRCLRKEKARGLGLNRPRSLLPYPHYLRRPG